MHDSNPSSTQQAAQFFAAVASVRPMVDAAQRQINLYSAPQFDLFTRYVRMHETCYSRMIADLLSPNGTHGQGRLFLDAFADQLKASFTYQHTPPDFNGFGDNVKVATEWKTPNGRFIDIVIEDEKQFIGIENKPFAGEQVDQLDDYLTALKATSQNHKNVLLVYAPGNVGVTGTIKRDNHGQIISLPYRSLGSEASLWQWLRQAYSDIEAPAVRAFCDLLMRHFAMAFVEHKNSHEEPISE